MVTEFFFYTNIQEKMLLLLLCFFLHHQMYIKKKPNSYVRERETQKNHRWNNDAYCNIENRGYTNMYRKKRHETVLYNVIHKTEKLEQ